MTFQCDGGPTALAAPATQLKPAVEKAPKVTREVVRPTSRVGLRARPLPETVMLLFRPRHFFR